MKHVQELQAEQYNKGRTLMHFEVGDMVMLSTKYLKSIQPKKKLNKSYEGPHKVVKVINQNAYQLELPPKVKLFLIFYILLLELY